MIQVQTLVKIADNSGAKLARCLKILKKGQKTRYGRIGDVIVVSIQKIRPSPRTASKIKKGDVFYGLIVKTRSPLKRPLGLSFTFAQNAVVLVNKQFKPIATRVLGLVPKELKNEKFSKIISLSSGTI
jgi:large subunit ribosomal protein L14